MGGKQAGASEALVAILEVRPEAGPAAWGSDRRLRLGRSRR